MATIRTFALLAAAGILCLTGLASADDKKQDKDQDFAKHASEIGLAEVNLGNLAATLSPSPAVKQFGRRMVADHTRANQQLLALANQEQIPLAKTMDKEHAKLSEKLSKTEGAAFDREYMHAMVQGHEKAIKLFEKEAKDGHNQALKAWAAETVPVLKTHLGMAEEIDKQIKGTGR